MGRWHRINGEEGATRGTKEGEGGVTHGIKEGEGGVTRGIKESETGVTRGIKEGMVETVQNFHTIQWPETPKLS